MTIVAVESIPKARKHRNGIAKAEILLDMFANSSAKIVKVTIDEGDYVSVTSAYSTIYRLVKETRRPVKIQMVNNEIYLKKII
jgi:hypothetical protein